MTLYSSARHSADRMVMTFRTKLRSWREKLSALSRFMQVIASTAPTAQTFTHGGAGGTDNTLTLGAGEYITSMVAHWEKKDGHTRIFYLNIGTSAGNSVSGGTQTDSAGSVTAPDDY